MAHELTNINGKTSMAYVGEKPWHGLGQELTQGASFDVWTKEAGLDFSVERAPVQFAGRAGIATHTSREVLFRSDNDAALGIVSKGYKIVQPEEVIHFFKDLADMGGFQLETAGSLQGGQKVWAMAKVQEGFKPIGNDLVVPYVLMTTSFDGTTATVAKLTSIRVVCNNTLTVAMRGGSGASVVKVAHKSMWDARAAKLELGLIDESWGVYQAQATRMAEREMTAREADAILVPILAKESELVDDVRKGADYRTIMDMFYNGKAIGSELTGGRTVWQFTNAVTEYYDHISGRLQDNRIRNAWYGTANTIKMNAWAKAAELVA